MNFPSNHRANYALIGIFLGLGAPAGSLLWRLVFHGSGGFFPRLLAEWNQASFYYIYMTIATVTAFTIYGRVLGVKGDALEKEKKRINSLAVHDGLTHLYNHRYLQDHLGAELDRAKRYKSALTCVMLDIDDFKLINDTYGHPFGDQVLRTIGQIIREQVRRVDTAGRYGGEEFLILMPHTTSRDVFPVAERIRTEVQEYPFHSNGTPVRVTLSIGIASFEIGAKNFADKGELLKAADDALYTAKYRGKNRAHVWNIRAGAKILPSNTYPQARNLRVS